nr:MAG TPA: major capsid protein [Bacteriophage sp.]
MMGNLERSLPMEFRAVEGEDRVVELSFSSEIIVERWWGAEILDHSDGCVDLSRLSEMGCVLFNHKRDIVIAKVEKAWIENNRGKAKIRFDEDEESDKIYQKVKSGTLRGVSTGYIVNNWESVLPGKKSLDGRFKGPCEIAKRWMPYEISIVSVPADASVGVGRSMEPVNGITADYYSRQLKINKAKGGIN